MTRQFAVIAALACALPAGALAAQGKAAKGAAPASAATGAAAAPAARTPPPENFEAARAAALPAGDPGKLIEPLFASCSGEKNDLGKRQCELIRRWHLTRLAQRKWYALADAVSLQQEPYDATSKTLTLTVNGCFVCARPPVVGGAPRLLTTAPPKSMSDGVASGIDIGTLDLTFDSAARAQFWTDKVRPSLRVEFVFGVVAPYEAKSARGVSIALTGHRLYNACNGDVLLSSPASKEKKIRITEREASCPSEEPDFDKAERIKREANLPESITRKQVQDAMTPVQARVHECGEEFELKQGVARVHLTIAGTGELKFSIGPPYDKGDASLCIAAALKEAKFPRFKSTSPSVEADYPFVLRK